MPSGASRGTGRRAGGSAVIAVKHLDQPPRASSTGSAPVPVWASASTSLNRRCMSRLTPYLTTGKAGRAGTSGSCRMVAQVGLHHPPSNGGSHPDAWSRHCAPGPLLCSPRPPSVKAIPKLMKSSRTPANSLGCPEARHLSHDPTPRPHRWPQPLRVGPDSPMAGLGSCILTPALPPAFVSLPARPGA